MPLTDSQIRYNLVGALKLLEKDIIDCDLPLSQYGYRGCEYFAKVGTYGKKSSQVRHWVASIVISDDKADVDAIFQFLSGKTQ